MNNIIKKNKKESFEEILSKIEIIATKLETSDIPLEEALKEFEYGILLIKKGQKILKNAEQQIKILLQEDNTEILKEFN